MLGRKSVARLMFHMAGVPIAPGHVFPPLSLGDGMFEQAAKRDPDIIVIGRPFEQVRARALSDFPTQT